MVKFVEINNLSIYLNNEEYDLFQKIEKNKIMKKSDLNEREQFLARNLVIKGVLKRVKKNDKIFYKTDFRAQEEINNK
ncbi:MAG: hypothetical protein NZZ41_00940 [Candidatus Dojkabacteria bacterium]|nr:hypothetical protein [Candidatus Dojkabacteria bacterium]